MSRRYGALRRGALGAVRGLRVSASSRMTSASGRRVARPIQERYLELRADERELQAVARGSPPDKARRAV